MSEVDHPGNLRPWFRRRWFKCGVILLALPFVLFGLSNLWLALPWGRHWVAAKVSSRIGSEARVAGSSWSPWGGVCINGLVIEQPEALKSTLREPLFTAESIRVSPVWRAWLQRRIEVHSIEVESPRAVVAVEMLVHLAGPVPIAATPPPVVATNEAPTPAPPPNLVQAQPQAPAPQALAPPPPVPAPILPSQPTGWIHIHHGSLAIVSSSRSQPLLEASGINADIPAAGDPADSAAKLQRIQCLGLDLASDLNLPLHWQNPVIQIGPIAGVVNGIPYQMVAKLARYGSFPIGVEMNVPAQKDLKLPLPGGGSADAREFRAAGRFAGLLTAPSSWQGDLVVEGLGLSVNQAPHPEMKFDRGSAVVILRGGILSCTDARLIGDDLSLLGNATVFSDTRSAAVLRIVTGQDAAKNLANRIGLATGKRISFGFLGTPDRVASDVNALGNLDGIKVQLGEGGDVIDGPALISLMKAKAEPSP